MNINYHQQKESTILTQNILDIHPLSFYKITFYKTNFKIWVTFLKNSSFINMTFSTLFLARSINKSLN